MDVHWHPFQRVGAAAIVALCGVDEVPQVGPAYLDQVVEQVVADALMAARAARSGPGYAWWRVLAAAYPNSPPTHPARGQWEDPDLTRRLEELFAPDQEAGPYVCFTCNAPTDTRWGKSRWPLASADGHINHTPPDSDGRRRGGVPTCRTCRICLWAMPYGSIHNGHTITTIDLDDDTALVGVTGQVVAHNRVMIEQKAVSWGHPWQGAPGPDSGFAGQVLTWRNNNRSPSLSVQVWEGAEQVDHTNEESNAREEFEDLLPATGQPG